MAQLIDLTGQKFGLLTVLEKSDSKKRHVYWKCKCDCGNICEKSSQSLRSGEATHCGCQLKTVQKAKREEERINRHVGERYGLLTVIANTGKRTAKEPIWLCKCDCGNYKEVPTGSLRNGHTRSCGCLNIGAHGPDLTGKQYGKLTVLSKDKDNPNKWICRCECGNFKSIAGYNLYSGITSSCGCINYSIGEKNIANILNQNNIRYIKEYCNSELKLKRFDFAILDENENIIRLVEYDGEQHYKSNRGTWDNSDSLEKRQARDKEKDEYALSHNIPLVRIPYWERDNITLDMIMGNKYKVKQFIA